MPATYIELCNKVLRRLNEVELRSADFESARGVQALVKDSVQAAIASIGQSEFEWPFNAAQQTEPLVVGRTVYSWPDFFKVVDFNSFQVVEDAGDGTLSYRHLKYIDRDTYFKLYRDLDDNAFPKGRGKPEYVCASHGNGYIITPAPSEPYIIKYNYFLNYAQLTLYDDETRVPTSFSSVIVDGALMHMYMFKDNVEAAQVAKMIFEEGLKNLQTLYINNYEYISDTRVSR